MLQPVATGAQEDFPSHCCPQLLLVTALRAGGGLFVVSVVPCSTGEEALRCEGRTNKSLTGAGGKRSGAEGWEYMNRS